MHRALLRARQSLSYLTSINDIEEGSCNSRLRTRLCSYFVLHEKIFVSLKDATVTLEVKYTPPRGKDKIHIHKAIEEESDADSDVDKDEQDYDEVDAAEEIGARKSRRWHYPKSKRRRVSRKWSTKTKDFQVIAKTW